MSSKLPSWVTQEFLEQVLKLYSQGKISGGRAAQILGIPRAALYELLARHKVPAPKCLEKSILEELERLGQKQRSS